MVSAQAFLIEEIESYWIRPCTAGLSLICRPAFLLAGAGFRFGGCLGE